MILHLPPTETCAQAYADLSARLARFQTVIYAVNGGSDAMDQNWYTSIRLSRTGKSSWRQFTTQEGNKTFETDGRRTQWLDPFGSFNRPFRHEDRKRVWIPGFESLSDPGAKVFAFGEVRANPVYGGALMLDLVVYGQGLTLYLDPETGLPIGHGNEGKITTPYRSRRDLPVGASGQEVRYDVLPPDDPIPGPRPAAVVIKEAIATLQAAPEVRITRYTKAFWDYRPIPRLLSFDSTQRLGPARDVIVVRGPRYYLREGEDGWVFSDGTWTIRTPKEGPSVLSRAARNAPPEPIIGLEALFNPKWTSPRKGTATIEFFDGDADPVPCYALHYPSPTSPGILRVGVDGRFCEFIRGHTVLIFEFPKGREG